ncbi:3-oxoacyl-ACP synthase [Sphaerisporangium melleum]|uniref:3-oxoacyl-ACP synthase n=1 Tax=Sphaerisporangium melleum TaxID=321316 RepID=A0A917RLS2_9ACTN|nr:3-oxoacyl-[acyl-carrier-protein] synthase III C-terminal domain-containing protein [Sphaerisporangium melleum]GGL13869.1 3-oxoacyl-ACP synthase [Sphaerisporangium melleum]GII74620.1 3-oxoacyl-ACP synthase [Sphaerisporangium melleum]
MTTARPRTHTRLAGVAAYLPETTLTTSELEDLLAERNPGLDLPRGLIADHSGVRRRHVAAPQDKPSDLAVRAARRLLDDEGVLAGDLDLILYAGVSSDAVEPATGHVVAAKLGAGCPVFDVRNACNSVLNAIQVADALIATGRHRRVLVCCGEMPTAGTPWVVSGVEEFITVAASYTVSDVGAAVLLEAATAPGVLAHRFAAHSAGWQAAVAPVLNLTTDPWADRPTIGPLVVDTAALVGGIGDIDPAVFHKPLADLGLTWDDFAAICVHQATLPGLWWFCEHAGIPEGKVVVTVTRHGNLVAATLLVQLARVVAAGRVRRGDLVALVGLASGASAGIVVVRW